MTTEDFFRGDGLNVIDLIERVERRDAAAQRYDAIESDVIKHYPEWKQEEVRAFSDSILAFEVSVEEITPGVSAVEGNQL